QVGVDHTGTLTLPGLRDLTRQREDALAEDIAGIRSRVAEAEHGVERLWDKVKGLDKETAGVLASALVATALGRLGAGWIRCSNWRKIGRVGCRLPFHFLDDLLALLADFVVLTNICHVLPWLESAFAEVASPLIGTLAKAGAGVCRVGSGPPE